MTVEARIKEYITSKGISQTHLSKETGIPVVKLNLTLNGKRTMQLSEFRGICYALGVNPTLFLEPIDPQHPIEKEGTANGLAIGSDNPASP